MNGFIWAVKFVIRAFCVSLIVAFVALVVAAFGFAIWEAIHNIPVTVCFLCVIGLIMYGVKWFHEAVEWAWGRKIDW